MKTTQYFRSMRARPDRQMIIDDWILQVVAHPEKEVVQEDGRIRRWAKIHAMQGR